MKVKVARRFSMIEATGIWSRWRMDSEAGSILQAGSLRSFMKVTGLGMALPLNAFEIAFGPGYRGGQELDDMRYYFKEFSLENSRIMHVQRLEGLSQDGSQCGSSGLPHPGITGGNEFLNTP